MTARTGAAAPLRIGACLLAVGLAASGLSACDGDGGYNQGDPVPVDSGTTTSVTPNPGLAGAGKNITAPPSADTNGIVGGNDETGNND